MARIAVFDCFSGIAGDMALAALLDAGANFEAVRDGVAKLAIPSVELRLEHVARAGLQALHLRVLPAEERTYQPAEMRALIRDAGLPARVEARALAALALLEEAEALAHGGEAHFHEVGGVDALVDIVGAMLALESLDVAAAWCPVVTVGSGTIARAAHGAIPAAPGPAAAHILQSAGFVLRFVQAGHELVTPTGAAILAAVAKPGPATLAVSATGAGAGTFDPPNRPNALRVFLGELPATAAASEAPAPAGDEAAGLAVRTVVELAANIDDMPADLLAHARDRLLEAGALDAWTEAIGMKKGRAAVKLSVLALPEDEARLAAAIVRETTTLGVRVTTHRRYEAPRTFETFASSLGPVRFKLRDWPGGRREAPEFEDIRALAERHHLPAHEVHRRVLAERGLHPGATSPGGAEEGPLTPSP